MVYLFHSKTEESFPTREREELPNRAKNFGREQERERKSKKKKTATKKSKQQHKSVKMGEFLDILCAFSVNLRLKWLLFFEHQHNLYPSNTPHEKKRKKTRRKKW